MRQYAFFLLSLLSGVACEVSTSHLGIIDVSYHPHLKPREISTIFRTSLNGYLSQYYGTNEDALEQSRLKLKIDASASHIGDDIASVLQSLIECDEGAKPSSIGICLESRMNAISPIGAANLFEKILSLNHSIKIDSQDATATTTKSEEIEEIEKNGRNANLIDESSQERDQSAGNRHRLFIETLDIGLNDIGHDKGDTNAIKRLHKSLASLVENESGCCPFDLRMEACGIGAPICRVIGKALIDRRNHNHEETHQLLRNLYLCENGGIGDGGAAALAAALKLARNTNQIDNVLNRLDLSSCGVGDAGAEALAMAIECSPGCVSNLNLSNNKISDEGAIMLSNGIIAGYKKNSNKKPIILSLDLSNNDIGDDGAIALFEAVECGSLRQLSLRSCSLKWKSIGGLGTSISRMVTNKRIANLQSIDIDLSGNLLGKKEKKKKSGLSAAVSTNMANSMSFLQRRLKSGLKEVGLNNIMMGSSLESDDEAEFMDSIGSELADEDKASSSSLECGACEFYDNLAENFDSENDDDSENPVDSKTFGVRLGMRMCNIDEDGIAALAAVSVLLGDSTKAYFCADCSMNGGVCDDDELLDALATGNHKDEGVKNIAQTHLENRQSRIVHNYDDEQYDEEDGRYEYDNYDGIATDDLIS